MARTVVATVLALLCVLAATQPDDPALAACMQAGSSTKLSQHSISQWAQASRTLPALTVTNDWPDGRHADPGALLEHKRCMAYDNGGHSSTIGYWYKVINRTIYYERRQKHHYISAFEDKLLIATWLYEDFPDVDILVSVADTPTGCPLDFPWLLYDTLGVPRATSVSSMPNVASAKKNQATKTNSLESFDPIHYLPHFNSSSCSHDSCYTRGFAIPFPNTWWTLSLAPEQLAAYANCLEQARPWASKLNIVFWRGATTGGGGGGVGRGWTSDVATAWALHVQDGNDGKQGLKDRGPNYLQLALMNKRVLLALAAYPYPALDVALYRFYNDFARSKIEVHEYGAQLMQTLLGGSSAPLHEWSKFKFTVSIDGHGPPFRLPLQLLSGSVPLIVESVYQPNFLHGFRPHKHYVPLAYDLSDWVSTALSVVRLTEVNDTMYRKIAQASVHFAIQHFNILGQLDSFMTAIMGVKRHTPWHIQAPENRTSWDVLRATPPHHLRTLGLPREVKESIARFHASHE